ncbi:MAG: hypothetical protein K5840_00515 [Eubacterium sp.]|nr:hypothetical protein [Eubacterium sp.]
MKKVKQVMALTGVALLLILYIITFILAITDNSGTMLMFKASFIATMVVPIMIWAYSLTYKWIRRLSEDAHKDMEEAARKSSEEVEDSEDTDE